MVPGGDGLLLKAAKEIAADRAADLLVPLSVLAELAAGANRRTHDSPTRRDTREELQAISCGALDLADRLANPRLILFRRPLWDDVKPGRLRALAQTADWLLEVVHSGGGTSTLMDSLGAARDLLLIAVGVSLSPVRICDRQVAWQD